MKKSTKPSLYIPRSVHPISLGCSKNQVDLERALSEFRHAGFQLLEGSEQAEYLLINTCGFIDSAKTESIDTILALAGQRKKGQKILVAGCLSQRYMEDLKSEMPEVDLWTGTYQPGKILEVVGEKDIADICRRELPTRVRIGNTPHHAYLKIAEGCNRSCAFCAIPGIRGKQKSFDIPELIEEAQLLQQNGVQEISLIAQDLTYYGREKGGPNTNLETLLKALIENTDIPWIRLMYAYPEYIDDSLLEFMATEKRICKYLDMPIQHGSDRILKLMRRNTDGQKLRDLLLRIRKSVPEIAMRTTTLVGFPGETDEDYQQLLELAAEIRFERLGGFVYSNEDGTHAATLPNSVPTEVAQERLQRLLDQQAQISLERNQNLIGSEVNVLIDEVAEESEFHFYARTQWDALEVDNSVRILEGSATPGEFRKARIVDASEFDLDAILLDS